MLNTRELDKLEKYLKDNGFECERIDSFAANGVPYERHQVIVFENGKREWDAICNTYSYGYEEGLLEVMGDKVVNVDDDEVEGWLTADDIIRRLEK